MPIYYPDWSQNEVKTQVIRTSCATLSKYIQLRPDSTKQQQHKQKPDPSSSPEKKFQNMKKICLFNVLIGHRMKLKPK